MLALHFAQEIAKAQTNSSSVVSASAPQERGKKNNGRFATLVREKLLQTQDLPTCLKLCF